MIKLRRSFLLSLTLIVGVTILFYSVKATRFSGTFHLYLNQTSSVGVQLANQENVSLTINQGELNSSSSSVTNNYMRGHLIFNSSTPGNFTVDFSEGTRVWYNDGSYLDTGDLINYLAATRNILKWDIRIYDPFEHYTYPAIGLTGFVLTAASGFYLANKIRNRDDDMIMGICYSIVFLILGGGFIMVWLWG